MAAWIGARAAWAWWTRQQGKQVYERTESEQEREEYPEN